MSIEVREITTPAALRKFLRFPWTIYAADPLWVPPLLPDRKKAISERHGIFFKRGTAAFFAAYRNGLPAGTICAAHDPPSNASRKSADCVFGFFECVDDYNTSKALFDHAAKWAAFRGLSSLYGPFNLDYENAYGILIEGRDRPPALMCGHTPQYYRTFVERYGFEKARGDNLAFAADVDPESEGQQRLDRLAKVVRQRSNISVRTVNLSDWDNEIDRIHNLLVKSLAHLEGSIPWRRDVLEESLLPFKKLADPDLILFAEADGETIGWFPGIRNLNEVLIKVNGLRYPWNYITLLTGLRRQTDCLSVKSILVLPEYWNHGVGILLFDELAKRAHAKGYKWVDLSLTGEDNPQTPYIAEKIGARIYKRYRIYRKML